MVSVSRCFTASAILVSLALQRPIDVGSIRYDPELHAEDWTQTLVLKHSTPSVRFSILDMKNNYGYLGTRRGKYLYKTRGVSCGRRR
jgi:hypothetical protein